MRKVRRGGRHPEKLNGTTETHLLAGRCLIGFAGGCQVCSGPSGSSQYHSLPTHTLNVDAKGTWLRHRERLLAIWRDPAGRQPGSSGFNAMGYQGCGRTGLPCWAEIEFEGATLPKMEKTWPADVKKTWRELKDR